MKTFLTTFLSLSLFLLLSSCSSNSSFQFTTLDDALAEVDPEGTGTLVDVDGDGIPDGIDIDGDGVEDIPFDPEEIVDENGDPVDNGDTPPDPEDDTIPLRDPNGKDCNSAFSNALVLTGTSGGKTLNKTVTGDKKVLLVYQQSNGNTFNLDLSGMTRLKRVIVKNSGGSNQINVIGADMGVGFCNDMSGGSNEINIDVDSSARLVDLESGTGNNNSLDVFFTPTETLFYALNGNSNCVSATSATTVMEVEKGSNDNIFQENDVDGACTP